MNISVGCVLALKWLQFKLLLYYKQILAKIHFTLSNILLLKHVQNINFLIYFPCIYMYYLTINKDK